jgi:outer membrane protein assembly factor BamB
VGAAAVALLATGCGWGQFGYSAGRTNFNDAEAKLTADKLSSLDYDWFNQAAPDQYGNRAPVLDGDRLFVVRQHRLHAYDTGTGALVWTYELPNIVNGDAWIDHPALVSGRIVAAFHRTPPTNGALRYGLISVNPADGTATEIDLEAGLPVGTPAAYAGNGYVSTEATIGQPSTVESMNTAWRGLISDTRLGPDNPMVLGGRVYVSSGYSVDAFDPAVCNPAAVAGTCAPLWSRDLKLSGDPNPGHARMPVALSSDTIAVRTSYGSVWALDATTGAVRWRTSGMTGAEGIAVARGVLYAVSDSDLVAFDANGCGAATCAPLWRALGGARDTGPVVAADVVYTSDRGVVRAYNANGCGAATCPEVWSTTVDEQTDITWTIVYQSRIYLASDGGSVAAMQMYP